MSYAMRELAWRVVEDNDLTGDDIQELIDSLATVLKYWHSEGENER